MSNWAPGWSRSAKRGQVLVLFALVSLVLVGFMALAIDVGYLLTERREAQNAADAAALAGAIDLLRGETDGTIRVSANEYAARNGVSGGGANVAVDIGGSSTDGWVEVEISNPVERFFLGAIYSGDWEVAARAVAEVNDDMDGRYALVALEPPGMYVNGNMEIEVIGGSAKSNGDVSRSGQSNAFVVGGSIDAVGQVSEGNLWYAPGGFNDTQAETVDPLLGTTPPPDPPQLEERTEPDCWGNDCVLEPGYYANMTIKADQRVELSPGTYHFHNTRLRLIGTNAFIWGEDVMAYVDGNSGVFEPGTAGVHLTAPETSPYPGGKDGMVLWIANCSEFESRGNNEFYLKGIFYAPCSDVWLHGNPFGVAIEGQLIVGTLDIRGTSDFIAQYDDLVFIPRIGVYLVE